MSTQELDKHLESFYASIRKKGENRIELYEKSSLSFLKYGIKKHLNENINIDLEAPGFSK